MGTGTTIKRWLARLGGDDANRGGEGDAPVDPATATSRATGGVDDPDALDRNSTTGTTPGGSFVGRATGDESEVKESGAERRARYVKGEDNESRYDD